MAEAEKEEKDVVIFQTVEDERKPLSHEARELMDRFVNDTDDDIEGAIKPNGEINWACPCMAAMVSGPCGYAFREAFSCFHYSREDPKGSDCIEKFRAMSDCFTQFPGAYPLGGSADDDEDDEDLWKDDKGPSINYVPYVTDKSRDKSED